MRNQGVVHAVLRIMRSIWQAPRLGLALMTFSPILALGFGWEAFFPVALTSMLGGMICIMGQSWDTHTAVGQLKSELLEDLVSLDKDGRALVLGELDEREGDWFLAELPRAAAELRRRQRPGQAGCGLGACRLWLLGCS